MQHLEQFLTKLAEAGLKINASKKSFVVINQNT
jgi:hypothetical protein